MLLLGYNDFAHKLECIVDPLLLVHLRSFQ